MIAVMSPNRHKAIAPDEECVRQGSKFVCQIDRGANGHSGVVRDEHGVVRWRYGTRENFPGLRWGNPFGKLDFVVASQDAPKQEILIRRMSLIPSVFEIIEASNVIGRIKMCSLLRIRYAIEIQGTESWTFRLPLFTVRFWGGSREGARIWVVVGPSKMEWNILLWPGMDAQRTIAAISFIHIEWWNYS